MISQFLCPTVKTWRLWRRRLQAMSRWEEPRSNLTRDKVCGQVLRGVAFPNVDPSTGATVLPACSGCYSDQTFKWGEIGRKYKFRSVGGDLASNDLVLREQDWGMCRVCLPSDPLPIVHTPLPKSHWEPMKQSLPKFLWGDRSPMVCRQVCYQRLCNEDVGMPDP